MSALTTYINAYLPFAHLVLQTLRSSCRLD